MNKFSFIYLVFIYLLFAVYTYFGEINFEYQIIGCFLLILLFGIPHGAIDHIVYKTQNNISNFKFFSFYLSLIILYTVCWFIFPKWCLIMFLLLSAYHFGESQFSEFKFNSIPKKLTSIFCGIIVISSLIYYNQNELVKLSNMYMDTQVFTSIFKSPFIEISFYSSSVLFLLFILFEFLFHSNKLDDLFTILFEMILIHVTFYLFSVLIGFTLYFIFLHSLKVLKQEYQFLKKNTSNLRPSEFVKMLLPFTGLSIFFLIIFYIGIVIGFLDISTFLFLIIGISVITLPHVFIMANFYNNKVQ